MQVFTDVAAAIAQLEVPEGNVAIFWLGQAFFVLKGADGTTMAIDPFFSDVVYDLVGIKRLFPAPFPAARLAVDSVVFTHDHVDHYDPKAVCQIAESAAQTLFVGPTSCLEHARRDGVENERLIDMTQDQTIKVGAARLCAVYAEHLTVGGPATDAVGVVVELGGIRLYHTGDTVYNAELQRVGQQLNDIDVLCVPINGNYAVMNSLDAALYTKDVDPRVVIPMHYGMFAENTADPYLFVRDLRDQEAGVRPVVMAVGSVYLYVQPVEGKHAETHR